MKTPFPKCHICEKSIGRKEKIVIDHNHLTGEVRGLAHNECNLYFQLANYVGIFFHGGSRYDFKLIISEMLNQEYITAHMSDGRRRARKRKRGETSNLDCMLLELETNREGDEDDEDENDEADENDDDEDEYLRESRPIKIPNSKCNGKSKDPQIRVIASSCENFVSFQKPIAQKLGARFLDSARFLQDSLSNLAKLLDKSKMNHTRKFYHTDTQFEIASRKGVFPYEYIKNMKCYEEKKLPPKDKFYNSLLGCGISDSEYEFAQRVFTELKCKSLGDYNDHYLRIDVLLLADIFENFRDTCFSIYKIDPAHCYSAPSLSYNAMLKTLDTRTPLFSDPDMYMFIEEGIRGGFCNVSKRHVKTNNRYMGADYDCTQPENYILYIDANNLYGYCMSQHLPLGDYQWIDEWEITLLQQNILGISDTNSKGYILEVDLEIPNELHDKFSDFTLCPERLFTSAKKSIPPKLIATLHNKNKYIVHYRYLKTLLKNGFKLTKIHRAISFYQEPWMKKYIELNTERRKTAKSDFEKNFYKLMVNSCYGKMLENCRNRRDFHLVYKPNLVQRWVNKPNFKNRLLLNPKTNLTLIEMGKIKIKLDKNIQAGMSVLDISKSVMANFHYDTMKRMFPHPGTLSLLYTDTDSLIYEIITGNRDLYDILSQNKDFFDFSDYPTTHPCHDIRNKKVLGKFKVEANGRIISEFVALLPKLYCYKFHSSGIINEKLVEKKAKGVKRNIVSTELHLQPYLSILYEEKSSHHVQQFSIQSKHHQISTFCQKKTALTGSDDKRYILPDCVHTLPWGHHSIPSEVDQTFLSKADQKYMSAPPPLNLENDGHDTDDEDDVDLELLHLLNELSSRNN